MLLIPSLRIACRAGYRIQILFNELREDHILEKHLVTWRSSHKGLA